MGDEKISLWENCKRSRKEAERWNELPNGKRYQHDQFGISIAHCTAPTLNRMGQQYEGSNSYWETGKEFNQAILRHIVNDWENIYPKVLEILKNKEKQALKDCQSFIDEMQVLINNKE